MLGVNEMTSASDGDVERALAAMGATPLKYYSFGVVAVHPPASEHRIPPIGAATTNGLPPSGEGTIEQYRAHAVSTVFPLLGLALPEAFHIDVEPVWPVGPPVSDQGILLDRNGNIASSFAGLSHPAFTTGPLPKTSSDPKTYSSMADGASDTASTSVPFVMPAWLDPTRSAEPAVTPGPVPSPAPANLFSWLDMQASAPGPITPPGPPNMYPNYGSNDARAPLGATSQNQWAQNPEAYAPLSFSPFAQAGYQADHQASAEASVPPSVKMSPHWLDTIKHAEKPEDHVKLTDWSVVAHDEHVHRHLSPFEQTTPDPTRSTDDQAAAPFVIQPTQPEQFYAAATPAEAPADGQELSRLADPAAPKWHEPQFHEPSEPVTAPSHGALDTVAPTSEAAPTGIAAISSGGSSGGADAWQWPYQWSASGTHDISPASATPYSSGTSPAPSPALSTDASPHLSTDASPNLSTEASPNLSSEAPPPSKRNGSRPLADMFRTLGGGGANPMK